MTSVVPSPCDKGIVAAASEGSTCGPSKEPFILAATILASSMAFIDATVVNVALPALQRSLGATLGDVQWIVEAYELMLAALLLVGGAAGDRFGRRRVFLLGVLVFSVASIACGLSQSVDFLIAARGVQGIGGALLIPGSLAIISASFDKERRGRAIGTWSAFTAITMAFGPVLGGFIIDHGSWRYVFFMNAPIAMAVVALTLRHVPETRSRSHGGSVDWPGASLAAVGLGGVVYALIEGQTAGWSHTVVWVAFATGLVLLPAFIIVESRQEAPMLPLRLFRSRDFAGTNLLTLLLYAALAGILFFLPMNLIQVQGYTTSAAGAALLPLVLLMFALSRWAGGLVERYGAKLPLVVGPILSACGFALFAVPGLGASYWTTFFPAAAVLGFGMTLTVAPLTTTVMQSVSPGMAGTASGINNAVSSVAGLLAIASLGIVMSHTFNDELRRSLAEAQLPQAIVEEVEAQRTKLAAIDAGSNASSQERLAAQRAVAEAFVAGFRRVAFIAALLAVASAAIAWLMIGEASRVPGSRGSGGTPLRARSDSRRPLR